MDGRARTGPSTDPSRAITVREAIEADLPSIVDVCAQALRWSNDSIDADYFRWKHLDNPFGPSPIWLAEDDQIDGASGGPAIVGVRTMMRWELIAPDGRTHRMARAVDTATLPSHQGRGIFTLLTTTAVSSLRDTGVTAIFNTPNDKSRPGYLKMGWESVGRVPVFVRPGSLGKITAVLRSRTSAEKWGTPTDVGIAPSEAFADTDRVAAVLAATEPSTHWSTPVSVDYLRWRTGFAPLECRVLPLGRSIDDGFIVFRLRNRGAISQVSVLHVIAPSSSPPIRRSISKLLSETGADLAMLAGRIDVRNTGTIRLPAAGPVLTWRSLTDRPRPTTSAMDLSLGAIEMF